MTNELVEITSADRRKVAEFFWGEDVANSPTVLTWVETGEVLNRQVISGNMKNMAKMLAEHRTASVKSALEEETRRQHTCARCEVSLLETNVLPYCEDCGYTTTDDICRECDKHHDFCKCEEGEPHVPNRISAVAGPSKAG